jgi:hypothetical protein
VRDGDRPLAGVATGLAVALPAVVKLQLAFWSLGLLSVCLWLHRRNVRFAVAMISGAVAAALGVGLLDTVTLGRPFGSMIAQITTGREIARDFGVHPASAYARWLLEDHGAAFFVVLALLAAWAASGERRKRLLALLRDARVTLAVVIVPAVCFLLALLAIEHKELRYLVPVLPALYFVVGLLIDPVLGAMRLPRLPHAAAVLLVVVLAAASYARAMATPLLMTKYDLSHLEDEIYRNGALERAGRKRCLILLERPWYITRGDLILGTAARWVQADSPSAVGSEDFARCSFALLPERMTEEFSSAAGASWRDTGQRENGFALLARAR